MVTDGHGHLVVAWNHIHSSYDVLRGQKRDGLDEPERLPSIAKLDEVGNVNWSRALGKGVSRGVAIDTRGEIMIVGDAGRGQPPAGFASKIAADGRALWTKDLGPRMSPYGIAADANGNMVVTGISMDGLDVCGRHRPGPKQTAFLAKLDPAGSLMWARQIELGSWGGGEDVAVNPAGAIVVSGFGSPAPLIIMGDTPYDPHMFVTRIGP
jgi:DNA-binding beta-propeller fold protein YncE